MSPPLRMSPHWMLSYIINSQHVPLMAAFQIQIGKKQVAASPSLSLCAASGRAKDATTGRICQESREPLVKHGPHLRFHYFMDLGEMTKHTQIVFNRVHCFNPASRDNLLAGTGPGRSLTSKKHKPDALRRGRRATSSFSTFSFARKSVSPIEDWSGVSHAQLFTKHILLLKGMCLIFSV